MFPYTYKMSIVVFLLIVLSALQLQITPKIVYLLSGAAAALKSTSPSPAAASYSWLAASK